MEEQKTMEKQEQTYLLVCDHCKHFRKDNTKKQCEKIVYNKHGNVIFICAKCKERESSPFNGLHI